MTISDDDLLDMTSFERIRGALGPNLIRILGYFREDGDRAVSLIERAIRENSSASLVQPAHCIKGEALHFGARRLAHIAGLIEYGARECVELRQSPTQLVEYVAQLRPLYVKTLEQLEYEINPLHQKVRAA